MKEPKSPQVLQEWILFKCGQWLLGFWIILIVSCPFYQHNNLLKSTLVAEIGTMVTNIRDWLISAFIEFRLCSTVSKSDHIAGPYHITWDRNAGVMCSSTFSVLNQLASLGGHSSSTAQLHNQVCERTAHQGQKRLENPIKLWITDGCLIANFLTFLNVLAHKTSKLASSHNYSWWRHRNLPREPSTYHYCFILQWQV